MTLRWAGDEVRRNLAVKEFQSRGLSHKAAEALLEAGVFTVRDLVASPWTDEEAGARFVGLRWRLSVGANPAKIVSHIEQRRAQLLRPD